MLRTAVRMIGVGGALLAGVATAPSAWAQCTNTLPGVIVGGSSINASSFVPLAQGGAVNSIVSVLNTVNTSYLTSTSAFVSAPGNPQPDQQGSGAWTRGINGSVETEKHRQGDDHGTGRECSGLGELQHHDTDGFHGLPGRARHFRPQWRRHRR